MTVRIFRYENGNSSSNMFNPNKVIGTYTIESSSNIIGKVDTFIMYMTMYNGAGFDYKWTEDHDMNNDITNFVNDSYRTIIGNSFEILLEEHIDEFEFSRYIDERTSYWKTFFCETIIEDSLYSFRVRDQISIYKKEKENLIKYSPFITILSTSFRIYNNENNCNI